MSLNRARIVDAVERSPGIHLRALQRVVGLSFTTVRYHISNLANAGEIECSVVGRYTRVFPRGFPESERSLASILLGGSSRRVLKEVFEAKVASNKEISIATGLAESTVSKHMRRLLSLGIVSRTGPFEGRPGYAMKDPGRVTRLVRAGSVQLERASERYVELWDF
ncbi:MAG: winged helix-turn-helix transcriptional regulator [Thaumarchaeota archaeon]|nr:winged helix-turn-helix transcriptional regulator [Nitrososphaerota archaeon]